MVKKILLTKGKYVSIDDEDYDYLNQWKWYANKGGSTYYAARSQHIGYINGKQKQKTIRMHRAIMEHKLGRELNKEELIDHINHNGLDNTKENLRIVDSRQNNQNKSKKGASKHAGVVFDKKLNKWKTEIQIDGKRRHLGCFDSELNAAKAYEMACRLYLKENLVCKIGKEPSYKVSDKFTPRWELPEAKWKPNQTSICKGVCWHKRDKKWGAYKTINGKSVSLGYFDSEEEAHQARLEADKKYDKEEV